MSRCVYRYKVQFRLSNILAFQIKTFLFPFIPRTPTGDLYLCLWATSYVWSSTSVLFSLNSRSTTLYYFLFGKPSFLLLLWAVQWRAISGAGHSFITLTSFAALSSLWARFSTNALFISLNKTPYFLSFLKLYHFKALNITNTNTNWYFISILFSNAFFVS